MYLLKTDIYLHMKRNGSILYIAIEKINARGYNMLNVINMKEGGNVLFGKKKYSIEDIKTEFSAMPNIYNMEPVEKNFVLEYFDQCVEIVNEKYPVKNKKNPAKELAYVTFAFMLEEYLKVVTNRHVAIICEANGVIIKGARMRYEVFMKSTLASQGIRFSTGYSNINEEIQNVPCLKKVKKVILDAVRQSMQSTSGMDDVKQDFDLDAKKVFDLAYGYYRDWYKTKNKDAKEKFEELRGTKLLKRGYELRCQKNAEDYKNGIRVNWQDAYNEFMGIMYEDFGTTDVLTNDKSVKARTSASLSGNIIGAFEKNYEKMVSLLRNNSLVTNYEREIAVALYVLTDIAKQDSQINDDALLPALARHLLNKFGTDSHQLFTDRSGLYYNIINGAALRDECLLFDSGKYGNNPITRSATLLGDILVNPGCADDYENAPVMIHDIFTVTEFTGTILTNVVNVLAEAYFEVMELCKQRV